MKSSLLRPARLLAIAGVSLGISLAGADGASAQATRLASVDRHAETRRVVDDEPNALERGRYAILIDLDENVLHFMQGETTLWSAPVGTGTGMRMITHDDDWKFSTPQGRFQIQYKERDPVWIAPDWFFVENNLPVPAQDHSSRYMKGTLGAAAVYISPDLAIHGTDRPELIGQRVSHGCIRLENRYALRLYNSVQVGTEVIIVGGDHVEKNGRVVDLRDGYDKSLIKGRRPPPPPSDPLYEIWKAQDTDDLIGILADEFDRPAERSRWDEVAGILLDRARDGSQEAMDGLFELSGDLDRRKQEIEYAAYLVEAYRSRPVAALESLSDLRSKAREHSAELLVTAMVTLYYGDLEGPSVPWPTSRIPESLLDRSSRRGWDAIQKAEQDHRERVVVAAKTEI